MVRLLKLYLTILIGSTSMLYSAANAQMACCALGAWCSHEPNQISAGAVPVGTSPSSAIQNLVNKYSANSECSGQSASATTVFSSYYDDFGTQISVHGWTATLYDRVRVPGTTAQYTCEPYTTSVTTPEVDGSTNAFGVGPIICASTNTAQITLSATPNLNPINKDGNTSALIKATVVRNGIRVPNIWVTFKVVNNSEISNPKLGTLYNYESRTDAYGDEKGVARTTYYVPNNVTASQTNAIRATCYGCDTAELPLNLAPGPILIGFFNGVWNTPGQAKIAIERLKFEYGKTYQNSPLEYELFYNQTGSVSGAPGGSSMQDIAEVMMMRDSELSQVFGQRLEFLWDMLTGRYQQPSSLTGSVLSYITNNAAGVVIILDGIFNSVMGKIVAGFSYLVSNPPTEQDVANQTQQALEYANKQYRFVFVAHSQGNLFVNRTYDNLKIFKPNANAQVVHIAPASPTVRGAYVLADIDGVINGLRVLGINTIQNINLNLPTSKQDVSGHTFLGTYLDTSRSGYARSKALIDNALNNLVNQ